MIMMVTMMMLALRVMDDNDSKDGDGCFWVVTGDSDGDGSGWSTIRVFDVREHRGQ